MKIIAGEFYNKNYLIKVSSIKKQITFSASSNALRKFDSDSPANFDIISGPLIKKKNAPVSLATARAIKVLPKIHNSSLFFNKINYLIIPVPGGP